LKPKGGLGRGLAALLPASEQQLRQVDVDLIVPNPRQPRSLLDPDALADLAESIRQHGVIQPIVVTESNQAAPGRPSTFQIIAGERRWQAAKLAGLERVPVIVKEASSQQVLEIALVENIQRADLSPLEEAAAFKQLIDEYGLTQEAVADRVGRHRTSVTNTLRLLRLPDEIKELLAGQQITEGHARSLLALESPAEMLELARRVVENSLTVRQLEEATRRGSNAKNRNGSLDREADDPEWKSLESRLQDALGTKVQLARARRGGRMVIHFFSEEELDSIVQRLGVES
jgi:ParB family chromosome partitioning protein